METMSPVQHSESDNLQQSESSSSDRELRRRLRLLPQRHVPPVVSTRLHVLASKESVRRRSRVSWGQMWRTAVGDFQLWADNLMRPLAIPTAGGFFSALLLFAVLAPTLATSGIQMENDVPTRLYTGASVQSIIPFGFADEQVIVEVTINGEGRVVDYSLPEGHPKTHGIHRRIENYLLFTQFKPVTNFGQPVTAKVRISFQSSRIEVRG
jgi:hypothetical protein